MRATSSLTDRPLVRLSVLRISSRWVRPISDSNCWFTTELLGKRRRDYPRSPWKGNNNFRKLQERHNLRRARHPPAGLRVEQMRFLQRDPELAAMSAPSLLAPAAAPGDERMRAGG